MQNLSTKKFPKVNFWENSPRSIRSQIKCLIKWQGKIDEKKISYGKFTRPLWKNKIEENITGQWSIGKIKKKIPQEAVG